MQKNFVKKNIFSVKNEHYETVIEFSVMAKPL